jgi:hypothetical protein
MCRMTKKLRVGFDLDGVILYNPIRFARPFITSFKRDLLKKKVTKFIIPHTPAQKFVWRMLHWTSMFVSPGYADVRRLVRDGKIEAHLVTGRFAFLKPDLDRWLKVMKAQDVFTSITYNEQNEQPHLYKERVLKKLDLDIFIEDNWDIVRHLAHERIDGRIKTLPYWIYNIVDKRIPYEHKFPTLKHAVDAVEAQL